VFPRISDAKIKGEAFVGPQIKELVQDVKFEDQLIEVGGKKSTEFIQIYHPQFWRQVVRQTTIVV
jgi:hypothetical protein